MQVHVTRPTHCGVSYVLVQQHTPRSPRRGIMRSRISTGLVVVALLAAFTACGSDSTTTTTPSVTYVSILTPANEVRTPAVVSSASGTATYVLTGNILTYSVVVNGLT